MSASIKSAMSPVKDKPDLYAIYKEGSKNLVNFRSIFLPTDGDLPSAPFHYQWSNDLLNDPNHSCYEGFRESGKSSLILRAYPLYCLTYPDGINNYIVIIKSNQMQARRTLKNITTEFLGNPLLRANLKKVNKNTSDVFAVTLKTAQGDVDILIEVYGKGASIRGLNNKDIRPTTIILDDPQDTADMLSEVVPENDWDWFLSDVMFLGANARIFLIGNNLGEKCIAERIERNKDSLGFKFNRIPCADPELTQSTWKEKQSIEDIKKERDNHINMGKLDVWLREKMCISVSEETRTFKDSMYRYYTPALADKLADVGTVLAALDPASSKRTDSCLRAIVVASLMPDGAFYVLDCSYGRWDSVEMIDEIFNIVRKWGVREFGIEKGQYQQVLEPLMYREMTRRNIRFNIEELEHGKLGSKLERIKSLAPVFKSGGIWFPDNATWLNELKSELAGVTKDEIKSQYIDVVDCLAMVVQQMRLVAPKTSREINNSIAPSQREYVT